MRKKILGCCVLLILYGLSPVGFLNKSLQAAATPATRTPSTTYTFPLTQLMSSNEPIFLRTSTDEHTVFLPIAKRMHVQAATLHLEFINSIALLEQRSQLQVRLNDRVLAQVPLKPHQPEASMDIRLPTSLLEVGYNRLQFRVTQHYTLECEDPSAPELWTQINPVTSTLAVESVLRPLSPTLSALDDLMDRKLLGRHQLHILTATVALRDAHLRWGALIAQGAALRLQYVPVLVTHDRATRREPTSTSPEDSARLFPGLEQASLVGRDTVLIGTRAEIAPYASPDLLAQIDGSYLAVYPLDADPRHFLLLVSGRDDEEVTRAALSFVFSQFPFPDTAWMRITEALVPLFPPYTTQGLIRQNQTYAFSQFDFQTTTMKGQRARHLDFEVAVPPDLFSREESAVELALHLAYGAGLRHDSVLNLSLNGTFQQAIPLQDASGAVYQGYKVRIPLRAFQAGRNVLSFSPSLVPLITGDCQAIQEDNLLLTLFDDSRLSVPSASHYVRLPDLRLFARTAFPFAVYPDGSDLFMQVAGHESQTVAAAWSLMGKLAQKSGTPLHRAAVSFELPASPHNLVVLGALDKLNKQLVATAPLSLGQPYVVPYPSRATSFAQGSFSTPFARLLTTVGWSSQESGRETAPPPSARLWQWSGLGRDTLAMMFESPLHAKKTVVMVVANDPGQLQRGVESLVTPEIWEQLQGDVVVWQPDPASLSWQKAGADYHVGNISLTTRLEYTFSQSPWVWTSTVLALIGGFALITRRLLTRFKQRHHADVGETTSSD